VLRLFTFGGLGLESDNGSSAPRLRRPRLALLAVLAAAGDRGVSRERLAGLFWPDSADARARHSLRQTLYALRNDMGCEVVRAEGSTLALDTAVITADVIELRSALAGGDRARAVGYARGPFLDGFYLPGASAFERWMEDERGRLTAAVMAALLSLAVEATRANERDAAVEWWGQLTARDPLSGRFALGYLKALAARGDRAEALAFARQHEVVVRRELEADPDSDVRRLVAELRAMSAPEIVRASFNGAGETRPQRAVVEAEAPATEATPASPRAARPGHTLSPAAVAASPTSVPNVKRASGRSRFARPALGVLTAGGLVLLVVTALFARQRGWWSESAATPTFAVGLIREAGVPDSLRTGRVLTDMIATNLARIEGLSVLANSRVLELMRPGPDSAADYSDAARRAGAAELLEGQLLAKPRAALELEMRRVELRTGIVREVYRVTAADRYALVDSLTQNIARRFQLESPAGSVASTITSSPTAYRFYDEGLRAYFQNDIKAALRLMQAALVEDSLFAMAAYYVDKLAWVTADQTSGDLSKLRPRALRLADRAPERERLTITADLLSQDFEPRALAVVESLTTRYPNDPRALATLGRVKAGAGEWAGAVAAVERAIALDSAAEPNGAPICRVCEDLYQLADVYLWWDSLPAVVRTAERFRALRPSASQPFFFLSLVGQRLGDSAVAYDNFLRLESLGGTTHTYKIHVDLALEAYDRAEQELLPLLASSYPGDYAESAWNYLIALRNQGRLRDALEFQRTGVVPGLPAPNAKHTPVDINDGILALERGDARAAAATFEKRLHLNTVQLAPGVRARHLAWNGTLQGMALAAAGDTHSVRLLADRVEAWGRGSAYGRDRKAHHYLRGLVLAAAGRHDTAVREFQAAIHSPTLGFTRVNYELARSLLRLDRPREAVAALQPALRGELDASNLYITRTELHELLAQAFDRTGARDSAAVHYRAVVNAWARADTEFQPRRAAAKLWLARYPALPRRGAPGR
jgi:DNA-binding SARP family transcriptional activator/TolB-like protein